MKIARWLDSITSSPTMAVNQKVIELKSKGKKIISLAIGEPDFETPQPIKDSVVEALKLNMTRYTETRGISALREAICSKLSKRNNVSYEPTDIIVTCGAKQAISMALFVLLDQGDEALIPSPYWVSYPYMVKLARGIPVVVPTHSSNRYKLTIDSLEKAVSDKTKVLILNNPSNPTGVLYSKDELLEIARWCLPKGITIISDEIYERIVFSGRVHTCVASLGDDIYKNTVTINGLSKSHCMTGWRMGYAAAPKDLIDAMTRFQSHFLSHIPTFVQHASITALNDDSCIQPMVSAYEKRIKTTTQLMSKFMPYSEYVEPDGAFYIFPTIDKYIGRSYQGRTLEGSVDIATFLLEEAGVAVVPGLAFGMDSNIRISVVTSLEDIEDGISKIGNAFDKLQ